MWVLSMNTYTHTHLGPQIEARGGCWMSSSIRIYFFFFFNRQTLSLHLKLTLLDRLVDQKIPGSCLSSQPQTCSCKHTVIMPGFFVGAENLNCGPLAFRVIAFIHQTISPVLHQYNLRMFRYLELLKPNIKSSTLNQDQVYDCCRILFWRVHLFLYYRNFLAPI